MSVPRVFFDLISSSIKGEYHFPPTKIFEEGWMLRLLLASHQKRNSCFEFPLIQDATWFSEGILSSPFAHRDRFDPLAESGTRADGVIGNIRIRENTKTARARTPNSLLFWKRK